MIMKRLFCIIVVMSLLTACNENNVIKYDDDGKIISMDDPGDYTVFDKIMVKLGCHTKTKAYVQYVDFLMENFMSDLARKKISYALENDNDYWLIHYVDAYIDLKDKYFYSSESLFTALEKYDGEEIWGDKKIGKESILRNIAYYYCKSGNYECVNTYAQEALLLCKKETPEYNTNLNMIIISNLKNKKYNEAIELAKRIDDKEKQERLVMNINWVVAKNDSIVNRMFDDIPLYEMIHGDRAYTKSYLEFQKQYSSHKNTQRLLYVRMTALNYDTKSFEWFKNKYFSQYENYNFIVPIKLKVELLK